MGKITQKYSLYGQQAKQDAYGTFADMRRDDPVCQQPGIDGETLIWFLSRYEDVQAVLLDEGHFVHDPQNALPPESLEEYHQIAGFIEHHMLNKDGADHQRLRGLVSQAFTPRRVRLFQPRIQAIADELIDFVQPQGHMDLMADYAFHLPTIVISELLGIPAEARDKFKTWSNSFVTPALDEANQAKFIQHMQEFIAFLENQFAERRLQPQDDLLSALLQVDETGDKLSQHELYSTMVLLIVAGHETTVSLIGNAFVALWEHPDQMRMLREHPEQIDLAVEEFLRYDGSVERALERWVAEDIEIGGKLLRRGELVIPLLGSANHDETQFENPESLDISRTVNRHLGFGKGSHYCLGAPLARLEAGIAINTLLRRLPGLHPTLPADTLQWMPTPMFRRLVSLPVAWKAGS